MHVEIRLLYIPGIYPLYTESKIMINFMRKFNGDMLRTVIIDDEAHIRETLTTLLADYCPQVKVVGEAEGVTSGMNIIRTKRPDLVLLDIQMKDGTGFDMLNHFDNIGFKVIFVTAYEKHALEAFRFSAVDYILKPVNPEKLADAVERVQKLVQNTFNTQLNALKENLDPANTTNKKLVLRTLDNVYLVNSRDIIHCRSDDCYTIIKTIEGEKIMVSRVLKEFDELLSDHGFFRIHRSHLVNLQHIKRFDKQEGGHVVMTTDDRIPVSSRSRERLMRLFEELEGN